MNVARIPAGRVLSVRLAETGVELACLCGARAEVTGTEAVTLIHEDRCAVGRALAVCVKPVYVGTRGGPAIQTIHDLKSNVRRPS